MPVFMKVPCTIIKRTGSDTYGQPKFGASRPSKCAIVKLGTVGKDTTVRADAGATRGHAKEIVADSKILMHKDEEVAISDKIELAGLALIVASVTPRYDVMGNVDHLEVEGGIG